MYHAAHKSFIAAFVKHRINKTIYLRMKEYVLYMSVLAAIAIAYIVFSIWQKAKLKKFTNQSK